MKNSESNIWIGGDDHAEDHKVDLHQELNNTSLVEKLADETVSNNIGGNRRDFLKFLGFGLGAATVAAGCDIPVKRAIPYTVKPDEIVPGVATYYASSFVNGGDYLPILVKTREGRPIKIEGNDMSSMTKGGTSARAQATVLDLYDTSRFRKPMIANGESVEASSWDELDKKVMGLLASSRGVRLVTNTILSPTAKAAIERFTTKYNAQHVAYDPVSCSGMLDANEASFGMRALPSYQFDKADVIVSFAADFLGTWISPVEYARQYASKRVLKSLDHAKMSRHIQVESHMSMTGSNADNRILVKPSQQNLAIAYLYSKITGGGSVSGLDSKITKALDKVAGELKAAGSHGLVIAGTNNAAAQTLVNAINASLGAIGTTVDFSNPSYQRQGDDKAVAKLIKEMNAGQVDTVIVWGANPAYDAANAAAFNSGLAKVKNKIALAYTPSETINECNIIAPINHTLESWGDVLAKANNYGVIQPTIAPLFDTRQAELSLLMWADAADINKNSDQPYYEFLKNQWKNGPFTQQGEFASFQNFFDQVLNNGLVEFAGAEPANPSFSGDAGSALIQCKKVKSSDLEISFYETVNMGNGQYASNPWLQEMPDPVARTSWGNYLAVPVKFDGVRRFEGMNDLKDGDLVELTVNGVTVTVPVIQQFGQMKGTIALAMGYGRPSAGKTGSNIGVDVNPMLMTSDAGAELYHNSVSIGAKVGEEDHFSCVQYHHTYGVKAEDKATGVEINADEAALVYFNYGLVDQGYQGSLTDRSVIYHSTLKDVKENVAHLIEKREEADHLNRNTMYPYDEYVANQYSQGHHWGMHVDMSACIGCGACTVSCMAENNVPVVGKREVSRHHEMTWLRIDRYYYGDVENPSVVYQPMMCQHCDNAPCENVCPVNASNHSSEGLNQMAYNRCIGTRYCANNCPYKVRRFNWLDYTTADLFPGNQPNIADEEIPFGADNLTRMVLNPDVTVRSRGVIEKCSFCVQRLQTGKLTAKREMRSLRDADVKTACQTACPTGAITFGDTNNKDGDLNIKLDSPLNYYVLEEINVRPSVMYSMKVNNKDTSYES